jgi:uncharacterized protein (DUF849 family)
MARHCFGLRVNYSCMSRQACTGLPGILSASGTRYEFECYDTLHLYNLAHFIDRGLVKH